MPSTTVKKTLTIAVVLVGIAAWFHVFYTYLPKDEAEETTAGRPNKRLPDTAGKIAVKSTSEQVENLLSLGYVTATYDPNASQRGVLVYDEERAFDGYNLYDSVLRGQAYLLDMDGRPIHRWHYDIDPVFHVHVELLPDGDLLVQVYDKGLLRINRDSEVLWFFPARVHHDLTLDPDGNIYMLTRRPVVWPRLHEETPTLEDTITRLSPEGEELEVLSLLEMFVDSPYAFLLPSVQNRDFGDVDGALDIFHTNHVHYIREAGKKLPEVFAEGHFIVSLRNINTIAVFDWQERRYLWAWGPSNVTFQHHPTLLDNGNVLIFDNGRKKKSRVIEIDPETFAVQWDYSPEEGFFTKTRGGAQRLPNGNTLITESDKGYAFEITSEGDVVWKFANPEVNSKDEREALWRLKRFARDELPFLDEKPSDSPSPSESDSVEP